MDKQSNNSINEIKLLVLQLAQQFNKKFDEQARVIVDQRDQLESQQEQIYNQRSIIDELAWQIRDLRDSVRKCSEQISNVHLKYLDDDYATTATITNFNINNGRAENRLKLIIPETNATRQSNHKAEFSPIYESINFDAAAAAAFTKIASAINSNKTSGTNTTNTTITANSKNTQPIESAVSPLQRQNAFDGIDGSVERVVKRKQSDERDVRDFLERCIPPPPVTSPPPPPLDTDSDDTEQELDDPVRISHRTLMKLNSLYSVYKMRRSDISEIHEAAEAIETNEAATDDVVLRLHNKFDKCKSRLFRGSSKAMCSFVSNVEDDYLPRLNGSKNEDEHDDCDDDDNGFAKSTAANGTIGENSNDAHCQQHHQPQKPIYTQNDEVYI